MKYARAQSCSLRKYRSGKILLALAVSLPAVFALLSLYVDGSLMLRTSRELQCVVDAAATSAALSVSTGTEGPAETAQYIVQNLNQRAGSSVTTEHPPQSGTYAGNPDYVRVTVEESFAGFFRSAVGFTEPHQLRTRAVAGVEAVTAASAIVILEPDPAELTIALLPPIIPSLNPLIGGLEVVGSGELVSTGAILVNNEWGGVDENGEEVGDQQLLQHACSCTPVIPLTRVLCPDLRVVGGVDDPGHYVGPTPEAPSPLQANRRPVPDPLISLPVPTTAADAVNVDPTERGVVNIVSLPAAPLDTVLQSGVYDWIQIFGGTVTFESGVYIIRGADPATGISLSLSDCQITATDAMFYITDSATYSPQTGAPDDSDGDQSPPTATPSVTGPSVLIANPLAGSVLAPINDGSSPFHNILFFQRRWNRRPLIFAQTGLIAELQMSGMIYAKWATVALVGHGEYQTSIAAGSLRAVTTSVLTVNPTVLFSPAYDVFLVE